MKYYALVLASVLVLVFAVPLCVMAWGSTKLSRFMLDYLYQLAKRAEKVRA